MAVMSVVVPANARLPSARAPSASNDLCTLHRDQSTTCLKPSTFVHDNAGAYSSAVHTYVKNSATRVHAARVVKPSLTKSAADVVAQSCIRLFRAVPSLHPVDTPASAPKHAATRKYLTTAIKTMRLVPNVRSLWRSGACAGKRPSKINSAGCKMSAVAMSAVTSSVADRTSVVNPAIDQANAKMPMAKLASSPAVSPRRAVDILMRTCVMHHSPARKISRVRARSSLLANARPKSRK